MKIISSITKIFISSFVALSALNTQAAIIDFDSYFTDTETNLSWLDVTSTVNRSFNDVTSQLASGGEFDGWRYATGQEFNSLLSRWTGIASITTGRSITTNTTPSVDGLVTLFGSTLDSAWMARFGQTWDGLNGYSEGSGIDFTLGIVADPFETDANQRKVAGIWDNEANGTALDFYNLNHRQVPITDPKSDIGSYLVRGASSSSGGDNNGGSGSGNNGGGGVTEVSEPNAAYLLILGLVGLGLCRRKNII
jgi:hypothetical protein